MIYERNRIFFRYKLFTCKSERESLKKQEKEKCFINFTKLHTN